MRFPYLTKFCRSAGITPAGSPLKPVYDAVFDGNRVTVAQTGVINIQDSINSFGTVTDLHYMLHRLSIGDRSVLNPSVPLYADFSSIPNNPVDVLNIVSDAERDFARLSPEEQKNFSGDWRRYFVSRYFRGNAPSSDSPTPVPAPTPNPVIGGDSVES